MTDSLIFLAKDFNFDDCDYFQLDLICKYRLPILSNFPKLIIFLYTNPQFNEWLNSKDHNLKEQNIIQKLINVIKSFTQDYKNNIIMEQVNINDDIIWNNIINGFNLEDRIQKKNLSKKKNFK